MCCCASGLKTLVCNLNSQQTVHLGLNALTACFAPEQRNHTRHSNHSVIASSADRDSSITGEPDLSGTTSGLTLETYNKQFLILTSNFDGHSRQQFALSSVPAHLYRHGQNLTGCATVERKRFLLRKASSNDDCGHVEYVIYYESPVLLTHGASISHIHLGPAFAVASCNLRRLRAYEAAQTPCSRSELSKCDKSLHSVKVRDGEQSTLRVASM